MKELTIFYDVECGLCCQVKAWMQRQRSYLAFKFIAFDTPLAEQILPELPDLDPEGRIVIYADTGEVYQGTEAWITCLWALREWRGWAKTLSRPEWKPWAHQICGLVSSNRMKLSRLIRLKSEQLPGYASCDAGKCKRW